MALTNKKPTKAYLINVETLEISDIEVGDYRTIYKHIANECSAFDCVALNDKGDTLYVDDEGLMKPNHLFIIQTAYGIRRLAGNAVVLGTNNRGHSTAPTITKSELARLLPLSTIKKN
jgi:hypothetical protein